MWNNFVPPDEKRIAEWINEALIYQKENKWHYCGKCKATMHRWRVAAWFCREWHTYIDVWLGNIYE